MKLTIRHFFSFGFIFELFCFAFTMLLAMGVALNIAEKAPIKSLPATNEGMAAWQFILMFAIATVILLLILRYFNRPWVIQGLFYLAIIEGSDRIRKDVRY